MQVVKLLGSLDQSHSIRQDGLHFLLLLHALDVRRVPYVRLVVVDITQIRWTWRILAADGFRLLPEDIRKQLALLIPSGAQHI